MARPKVAKLTTLKPAIGILEYRTAKPPPKETDKHYGTAAHKAWREEVIRRAGGRCEWVDSGRRCTKAQPAHRMFADHITEIKDGGDRLDPNNGRCYCGQHHTVKTNQERDKRMAAPTAAKSPATES